MRAFKQTIIVYMYVPLMSMVLLCPGVPHAYPQCPLALHVVYSWVNNNTRTLQGPQQLTQSDKGALRPVDQLLTVFARVFTHRLINHF